MRGSRVAAGRPVGGVREGRGGGVIRLIDTGKDEGSEIGECVDVEVDFGRD